MYYPGIRHSSGCDVSAKATLLRNEINALIEKQKMFSFNEDDKTLGQILGKSACLWLAFDASFTNW